MTATCKNGVGIGTGQTTGQWPEIRKDTTITINDHAKVDASGSTGIGSGTNGNQANYPLSGSIIIKDDAKVEYARGWNAIGFIDDYKYKTATSELKILGNATLEDLQGYYNGIGANNVTIGDDTGKVTIKNLESSQYYYGPLIRANESLTIASNADITLTQPTQERNTTFIKAGVDADGNSIYLTKADLEQKQTSKKSLARMAPAKSPTASRIKPPASTLCSMLFMAKMAASGCWMKISRWHLPAPQRAKWFTFANWKTAQ